MERLWLYRNDRTLSQCTKKVICLDYDINNRPEVEVSCTWALGILFHTPMEQPTSTYNRRCDWFDTDYYQNKFLLFNHIDCLKVSVSLIPWFTYYVVSKIMPSFSIFQSFLLMNWTMFEEGTKIFLKVTHNFYEITCYY